MKETQCILFVIQSYLAEQALEQNENRLLYTRSHLTDSAVAAAFSSRREPKEVQRLPVNIHQHGANHHSIHPTSFSPIFMLGKLAS